MEYTSLSNVSCTVFELPLRRKSCATGSATYFRWRSSRGKFGEASLSTSCIACDADRRPAATVMIVDPLIVLRNDGTLGLV